MHSLLKRQIKKMLSDDVMNHPELESFLDAINRSYADYDEKVEMITRATSLSSTELYEANKRLNKETERQRKVLDSLTKALAVMNENNQTFSHNGEYNHLKLLENIENQANKIVEITEEKEYLLKNLEAQNESLNNYAHMVSHDLKSPIRNIYSLVTWFFEDNRKQFSKENERSFELIFQNLTKMDSLIDGILRHATIDALEEKITSLDVNALVNEIVDTIYIPKNVRIKTKGSLPILYIGKYRLEQLLKNLITNAITATEDSDEGLVILEATERDDEWIFSVSDNGKGIPAHLQEGIFDMFKKLENDRHATGIGLALVKKIVNYYKGDIWLSSEEGVGTVFYFTIKKMQKC